LAKIKNSMVWEEAGMDFSQNQQNPAKRLTGIGVAVVLHVIVGYVVVSGMGKQLIEKIKHPIETKIIEEVKPPPKDLPPPPPPPEIKTPPPPFIPPPEVVVQQQQVQPNTITTVTNVQPASNVLPRAPIIQAPVAAKPTPPARTEPVVNVKDCPVPDYPRNARRNEEQGTVTIEFLIGTDGRVKSSNILHSSGSRELDRAAVASLSSCDRFRAGTENGKAVEAKKTVLYQWTLE
jgi:protein TonB